MKDNKNAVNLAAPCGLYCGICTLYRAYHDQNLKLLNEMPRNYLSQLELEDADLGDIACEGCRSDKVFKYCTECQMRKCVSERGLEWCYECAEFPCEVLRDWQSYWSTPITENLRQIQKIGLESWLKKQETRWACEKCGTKLHWFSCGVCPSCGEVLPERTFPSE